MWLKWLIGILGVLNPFKAPLNESALGPQTPREAAQAFEALYGQHDVLVDDSPSRAGIKDTKYRWPGYPGGAVVPYRIHSSLGKIRPLIKSAIKMYNEKTCIKFVERTNEKNYLTIMHGGKGCSSHVGMINRGSQPVNLGNGCHYMGVILHELGHAIGLYHEHQRSDRDNYVTVFKENVKEEEWSNFEKTEADKELIFTNYDYDSIMHYGSYAYSKKPKELKTIVAKNGHQLREPFDKGDFTKSDIETINKLYKCK